jgi:lipopolysaccharide export system protein LptA
MARWQRHARWGLALFAVAFAASLWYVRRERPTPKPVEGFERLDPKAVTEIRGGDVIQVKGAKQDIKVQFGSQVLYSDGRTKLTSFKAFIDNRGGRSLEISGNEAMVGAERSSYDVVGNVTLKTSDGLTVTTPQANFTEQEGILRGPGPVQFQRERVSGSGIGFTYDRNVDRLWLLDKAVIQVAPDGQNGAMQATAGFAGYSRVERYMRFERGTRLERQGQVMEADNATIFLLKDKDEPENVELRGNSKITGAVGSSSLQAMQAQDITLHYGPDGRTLEHALLVSQSNVQLARQDGTPGQQMQADTIDATLAADGAVTRLIGKDAARVTIPASADSPPRVITSPNVDGSGEAGKGLTAMTFDNGVEYREDAKPGNPPRVAKARTMKAVLTPAGAVDAADFLGSFRFEEGKMVATSLDAQYQVTKGTLALKGGSGVRPHVADERVSVDADKIDVTLSPRVLSASGTVRSESVAGARAEGQRGNSLLSDKESVIVTADDLRFEEASGKGNYKGQAHLFQASGTSIRGDEIAMNETDGTLSATGNVLSVLPIAGKDTGNGNPTSIARSGEFQFDDAKRRAVFIKQAQLDGAQGNVHADRIELFLAASDNTLERLEAQTTVEVAIDKRKATGQHLTYHPPDEKYVLTGSPVRLVQECQESTGRTLTFYKASDRIQVDGNEEVRVQTKGAKCPDAK